MEKNSFKLTFKPINISKAIHILTQDLNNDQMSDEIIQEIGETFMKHMFYKVYEGNENLTDNTLISEEQVINNESENKSNVFNELQEKKKLMKYLVLGWYIYNYCL